METFVFVVVLEKKEVKSGILEVIVFFDSVRKVSVLAVVIAVAAAVVV